MEISVTVIKSESGSPLRTSYTSLGNISKGLSILHRDTCSSTFLVVLFIIAINWKHSRYPSTRMQIWKQGIITQWNIIQLLSKWHYKINRQKNGAESNTGEDTQTSEDKYSMFPFICGCCFLKSSICVLKSEWLWRLGTW